MRTQSILARVPANAKAEDRSAGAEPVEIGLQSRGKQRSSVGFRSDQLPDPDAACLSGDHGHVKPAFRRTGWAIPENKAVEPVPFRVVSRPNVRSAWVALIVRCHSFQSKSSLAIERSNPGLRCPDVQSCCPFFRCCNRHVDGAGRICQALTRLVNGVRFFRPQRGGCPGAIGLLVLPDNGWQNRAL